MIFLALIFYALWAISLRYDIWMFQQNSYMPSRYYTWFKSDWLANSLSKGLLSPPKVPLVWTRRVIRIVAVSVALGLLLLSLSWKLGGTALLVVMAVLVLLLDKLLVVLANLILSPVEALIRRWYYQDARRILDSHPDLVVIGVTGSYGKTSTKNYRYRILSEKYNVLVTPGNYNTSLGVVRTIRAQLKPYHRFFIVEMGAKQPGDVREICRLVHPTVGIVTAVGPMHLETFGSVGNVRRTKFELLEALPEDGVGIVNLDSEGIASAKSFPCRGRLLGFGIRSAEADYKAGDVRYSPNGTSFTLDGGSDGRVVYHTPVMGEGNVLDIIGAAVAAEALGVEVGARKTGVSKLAAVEHRLSISTRGGITVIDDAYNSNPEGAAMALDVLQRIEAPEGAKRIVVTPGFVEMGPEQDRACEEFGRHIAEVADGLIVVNRLNRDALCKGAGSMGEALYIAEDLREASAMVARLALPGDIVLYENDLPDSFK